ncbi:B3 domain-containing protein Os06g0112300-like isoform X6 [Olea europaea var. sylvestris]|uniref:B3 domain-containing protein Os06g0112300-like isoform X6 n=1 Tax=Olea europaea var. sylvestris TaxID=158386 RepID=UPI000C1D5E4F|nr:B3 domain-containing protein Os06g0112300-like isoform X6 [Olea europaea var. sylvestris]
MSSSSKDIYIPMFSGEHFDHWSVKMKTILISEDLWEYVEDGYEAPNPTLMLTAEQKQQLRENRKNDAKALSIIQRGVSSRFFRTILNAKTAKEAWDNLHKELQKVEGTSKPKPMLSSPDIYHLDEEGITPLLELPFYDLMLSKAHVGPTYQMSFPPSLDSKLPSTTVPSIIKCFGKTWELKFCGDMTPKCFDSSWRKFVDDNNLVVGDALIFELLESSSVKVMFKVQFLSCAIPPELQEQINKSRAERQAIIIDDE